MKRNTILLFLFRMLKIGMGILTLSLSAKYFGVSLERDVWILSSTAIVVFDMAVWGALNEIFRVKFIFLRSDQGEQSAMMKTRSLLFYCAIISFLMVVLVFLFKDLFASAIAPKFHDQQRQLLMKMLILVAPSLIFSQLTQLGVSLLNAYESFFIPEITGFITAIINLGLIIFLAPTIGIYALLLSYYISILLLFILIFLQIRKRSIPLFGSFRSISFLHFKEYIIYALPFFFPYFFGQLSGILEKTIVSGIGVGSVSIIDYSRKFTEMLTSVLSSVLVTILVPTLSSRFSERKPKEFVSSFLQIYQLGFLLIAFVIALFSSSSQAFVQLLYNKGSIDDSSIDAISQLVVYYSWAALPVFCYLIFGMAMLSAGKSKKYAFWGVVAQLTSIVANLLLVNKFGLAIIPFSLGISHLLAGIFMFKAFPFPSKRLFGTTLKYLSVIGLTLFTVKIINFNSWLYDQPIYAIAVNSTIIGFSLLVFSFVFRLEEVQLLTNLFKRKNK